MENHSWIFAKIVCYSCNHKPARSSGDAVIRIDTTTIRIATAMKMIHPPMHQILIMTKVINSSMTIIVLSTMYPCIFAETMLCHIDHLH